MSNMSKRKQLRLRGYDYSQNGYYFVTICTKQKGSVFGTINDNKMSLYAAGKVVQNCWEEIPAHYPFVLLDQFVIMPNHVHGIIVIANTIVVGANNHSPLHETTEIKNVVGAGFPRPHEIHEVKSAVGANNHSPLHDSDIVKGTSRTLGAVVRGFKIGVVKGLKEFSYEESIWQRNYFEHIIRSDKELQDVRTYIADNPKNWKKDKLYYSVGE